MGKKQASGEAELPTQPPGQRSIASMFSKSRIGNSAGGSAVPLMEFLNRKSEKRGSLQGCVTDAGLTLAVRERLDPCRKNDTRSTKRDEGGNGIGQVLVDECTSSCHREKGIPTSEQHWRSESTQGKLPPGRQRLVLKNAQSKVFIDLSEDEDGGFDGEVYPHEESSEISRKREVSQIEGAAMELCPVCNDVFPREMLQAHVEAELDDLEKLETDLASQSQDRLGDEGRFSGHSKHYEEAGVNSRSRPRLLVLGDEPKRRKRIADVQRKDKGPSSTFNHYADGGGWWDEGGVGVDAEAVGSASVWEGLGSMSFGGML